MKKLVLALSVVAIIAVVAVLCGKNQVNACTSPGGVVGMKGAVSYSFPAGTPFTCVSGISCICVCNGYAYPGKYPVAGY
jgi:hypothetical protein